MKAKTPGHPALDLCRYIDASPTAYHAVAEAARRLKKAGYTELFEKDSWALKPTQGYFVIRGDSAIIAWHSGSQSPTEAGFALIGAHTDSPCLKLKPRPLQGREGYAQLGVEVYGGVLLSTWLDRDLGVSGRLFLKGTEKPLLVHSSPAIRLRIPALAIHLDREVNEKGLVLNRQQHLPPVLALTSNTQTNTQNNDPWNELIIHLLENSGLTASQAKSKSKSLLSFDLSLHPLEPSTLGGLNGEFVYAPRLDNLASCHAALTALIQAAKKHPHTLVVGLFDHEEVGSDSAEGAGGSFLEDVLSRIAESPVTSQPKTLKTAESRARAFAHSFHISSDMAHAVHPNYADRHEPKHLPRLGAGPVIKTNAQQRYATNGHTASRLKQWCHRAGIEPQDFVTRTDLACGSTIGPITATRLGIPTVDLGAPMLSMHSIREMASSADHAATIKLFETYFNHFSEGNS